MSNWRDSILREFAPNVSRLTLVADPDGLLLEEGILQGIRERGFELIPFEDHVAFRFAYESKFRTYWDQGQQTDLVVVLRSPESDLSALPYDLLQTGRRLSFNLGEIFPHLSYPVITALNREDLDLLYEAQQKHAPGPLGDNATKEFVLRQVYAIAPELIKEPTDFFGCCCAAIISGNACRRSWTNDSSNSSGITRPWPTGLWKSSFLTGRPFLPSCKNGGPFLLTG